MRFFVQRGNDDAYAHITLKANRLNFRKYHAQGAGASAVIAGSLGCVTFSSSRTLGRLSQRRRQNTQQGRSCKARTGVVRGRCIRTFLKRLKGTKLAPETSGTLLQCISMVRFGGVTDLLPIPFFEFENRVQLRDLSFRTRLWRHNAISRIFTSTNLGPRMIWILHRSNVNT